MEDEEIVRLYWKRDERAIGESEKKYGSLCRTIALRVLESPEDAEGVSVSAVHRRLGKLRAALAAHLEKEGFGP